MKIAIANDHRGLALKKQVETIVNELGHERFDFGTFDDQPVDYPDVAYKAVLAVANKEFDRAILLCATGMGMSIAANKIGGIRAILCYDELNAQIARTHNDANVLCLAADFLAVGELRKIITTWLNTEFSGGRHQRRIDKISAIRQGKDPRSLNASEATK